MDVEIALNEVVPALQKLQKAGKTRFIGFSGVGEPAAIAQGRRVPRRSTPMQVVYNALNPSAGGPMPKGAPGLDYGRVLERAKANDMGTIIIRALAGGALAGTEARHPLAMQVVAADRLGAGFRGRRGACQGARAAGARGRPAAWPSSPQRFVIANPDVTTMLVGYSTLDQLEQAAAAVAKGPLPAAAPGARHERKIRGLEAFDYDRPIAGGQRCGRGRSAGRDRRRRLP